MKWEVKKLADGRWGVFLCKKYWKFKDKPVMYSASITESAARRRVTRLNNPVYDFGMNYVTVKQAREAERIKKADERAAEKQHKAELRAEKKRQRELAKVKKKNEAANKAKGK